MGNRRDQGGRRGKEKKKRRSRIRADVYSPDSVRTELSTRYVVDYGFGIRTVLLIMSEPDRT